MNYVSLGNSGLKVSTIGLGTWVARPGDVDGEYLTRSVRRAYELGVNFFDTANEYSGGRSEELLGQALRPFVRGSSVVATKACLPVDDGPTNRGFSRKHLREQVRACRARRRVDAIDLFQCHDWDPGTPLEETCSAMTDLIRKALPVVARLGLGVIPWSPLAMGILIGKYSRGVAPDDRAATGDELASDYINSGLTPGTLSAADRIAALADDVTLSDEVLVQTDAVLQAARSGAAVSAARA